MDRVSLWGRGMPPRTAGGLAPTPVLLRLLARHRADPRRWVEGVSKGPWVTAQQVLATGRNSGAGGTRWVAEGGKPGLLGPVAGQAYPGAIRSHSRTVSWGMKSWF